MTTTATPTALRTRLFRKAAMLGLLVVPQAAAAQGGNAVTYTRDVAPILQQKCQVCHRPGSIAPMSLLTYDDAKTYAPLMKIKVEQRIMPPYHIDRTTGIQQFKNDRGLTDTQIETIVKWVDAGAPMGDPADLPPAPVFPDATQWQLAEQFGQPDLVIRSTPYDMPGQTQDKWFRPTVETGVTEPRWVRAIEIRPANAESRKVLHHVLTLLVQQEQGLTRLASSAASSQRSAGLFMEWAVGKVGEVFAGDAGKLMLPGSQIRWEVHMHATGQPVEDVQAELGIYFYPRGYEPQNRTVLRMFDMRSAADLDIAPGRISVTQEHHVLPAPARLENFQPHMHMRGKAMQMEAIYPDGRKEMLSRVSNFQWNWHVNYVYADDAAPLLPKGTVLVFTAWHDNTCENPNNPDCRQWVGWGDRTVDEMAHAWIDVTYLEQEEFDRLVAIREARKKTATESGGG